MFEHVPEPQSTQKPALSQEDLEEIQIPIQKGGPVEITPPPPQQADLKKIPGHKKLWIILSVVLGVIVVGVGGVFAAHISGLVNLPIVDTILNRDTTNLTTLTSKISEVKSGKSDTEIVVAIEPQTIDAKKVDDGFLGGLADYLPIDTELKLQIGSFVSSEGEHPKGTVTLAGTYESGGTTLNADIESRMLNGVTYVRANTLPSLPFFSFEDIIGKWIMIPSAEDVESQLQQFQLPIPSLDTSSVDTLDLQQFMENLLTDAHSSGFISLSKRISVDDIDGVSYNHYSLEFDKTRTQDFLSVFLTHERDACKTNSNCFVSTVWGSDFSKRTDQDITSMVNEFISDSEASQLVDFITQTISYDVWMAKDGSAYQLKLSAVIDGSSQSTQLAGQQIRIQITSRMSHINEEPQVEKPTVDLTIDDLAQVFSGYSDDEWNIVQQKDRVAALRDALGTYKTEKGSYPENLSALPSTVEVTDLFTKQPYTYAVDGVSYTLVFQITTTDSATADSFVTNDIVIGKNTADMYVLSREAESAVDSDFDGLNGAQELTYKTNPLASDTDMDGTSDFDEVQASTDPLDQNSNPTQDIGVDSDNDGLTDAQEELYGTNPKLKDTDLDGYGDKNEIDAGYNPLSSSPVKTYGMRVEDSDWIRGAADAKVTVVSFCTFSDVASCNDYFTYLKTLLTTYPNDVRIVYKHLPKEVSASALECAGVQGKFFEMHDKMLAEGENYTVASMNIWADELDLDTTAFAACLNNNEADSRIADDVAYADLLDIQSVPVTMVNGTLITGAQTSVITSTIEAKLEELE